MTLIHRRIRRQLARVRAETIAERRSTIAGFGWLAADQSAQELEVNLLGGERPAGAASDPGPERTMRSATQGHQLQVVGVDFATDSVKVN